MVTGALMDEFSSPSGYSDPSHAHPREPLLSGATPSLSQQKQVLHPETSRHAACKAGRPEEDFLGMCGDQPQVPRGLEGGMHKDLPSDTSTFGHAPQPVVLEGGLPARKGQ